MKQIFVGGTGRCGTTILKRVIKTNPQVIALRNELRVLIDPDGALDLINALSDNWDPYHGDLAVFRFESLLKNCGRARSKYLNYIEKVEKKIFWTFRIQSRNYLGMGFAQFFGKKFYKERLAALIKELEYHRSHGCHDGSPPYRINSSIIETRYLSREKLNIIIRNYFDDLYQNAASNREKYWLDDSPPNLLHVIKLREIFPEMKFIHIYRDPRDVVASHHQFTWGGDNWIAIAMRIRNTLMKWKYIRTYIPQDSFIELSLEELANDKQDVLSRINSFLEIDGGFQSTEFQIDKVNQGRWKCDIPAHTINRVEKILQPFIEEYEYK